MSDVWFSVAVVAAVLVVSALMMWAVTAAESCTERGGMVVRGEPHYRMVGKVPVRTTPSRCVMPEA